MPKHRAQFFYRLIKYKQGYRDQQATEQSLQNERELPILPGNKTLRERYNSGTKEHLKLLSVLYNRFKAICIHKTRTRDHEKGTENKIYGNI